MTNLPIPQPMPSQPHFTPEEVEKHVHGMDASVDLINKLIQENVKNQETLDTMSRNVRHLEIMLAFDDIKNSEWDLAAYNTAITNGTAWMTA